MRAAVVLIAILLAGCLEGTPTAAGGPVASRTLDQGNASGVPERARSVIDTVEAWKDFWARHVSTRDPPPGAPTVDFERERVVIAMMGERGNGCHAIVIEDVRRDDEGVRVEVVEYEYSGGDLACSQALVQPYHFIAIEDAKGPVRFAESSSTQSPVANTPTPTPTTTAPTPTTIEKLSLRTLEEGGNSGHHGEVRIAIRDEPTWRTFWADHASNTMPAPDAPAVEWGNESVVAVVLADKPNGCYAVRVTGATFEPGRGSIHFEVTTYAPPLGSFCTSVISQPFHYAAFPERAGDAVFDERTATGPSSDVA